MTDKKFLTALEASNYITNNYFPCSFKSLAKLRCVGGSPKFSKVGNKRILYSVENLKEWAEAKISPAYHNTTEADSSSRGI